MSANSYFSEFQNFIQGAFPIAPTLPPQLPSYNIVSTDYVVKLEEQISELRNRNSELEAANADLKAELELIKAEDYAIKNEMIECKDAEINHLKYQVEFLQKEKFDEYENHIEDVFKWSEEKTKLLKKIEELKKSVRTNETDIHQKIYIEPIFDTLSMSIHNYYSDEDDAAIPIDIDIDSEVEAIEEEQKITKCLKCKNLYDAKGKIIGHVDDDDNIKEIPRCVDCSKIFTDRRGYMSYVCDDEYYGMYDPDGNIILAEDDVDDLDDDNSSTNAVSDDVHDVANTNVDLDENL